ncbi:MAG: 30S ribosomal protein S5 [Phycisphaeraceae bacterium]|nr:30S ribosomal protein S5 [Phycisphaerales bacterium]MCB9842645.1 30S ribosomal protein S5 [Phycisphaeraceae bacterium]
MAEMMEEKSGLESTTIGVFRSAATVAGGRRFSFGSMVVMGDRHGTVGLGYAKANQVPQAIEKAEKDAKKNLKRVTLHGGTIPHEVEGTFGASKVRLIPASPGTGVVAGGTVRAVLEAVGVTDCLTKCYGSTNKRNVAKATIEGLRMLRNAEHFSRARAVRIEKTKVDDMLGRGGSSAKPMAKGEDAGT